MRLAFLSDVHANLHALSGIMEFLEGEGIDEAFCLGDIVGYNAHPNECIEILRKHGVRSVMGNHDWAATQGSPEGFNLFAVEGVKYARRVLKEENARWLRSLPRELHVIPGGASLALYHGSPRDPLLEYVFPFTDEERLEELARIAGGPDAVVLGHTHLPMRLGERTLFLNPGSVGQPRDGDPRASCMILDPATRDTTFHRVPYDVEAAAQAVRSAGLPDHLWQRLLQGV